MPCPSMDRLLSFGRNPRPARVFSPRSASRSSIEARGGAIRTPEGHYRGPDSHQVGLLFFLGLRNSPRTCYLLPARPPHSRACDHCDMSTTSVHSVGDAAIATARRWAQACRAHPEPRAARLLAAALHHPEGLRFTLDFVDQVVRPEDPTVAAAALRSSLTATSASYPLPCGSACARGRRGAGRAPTRRAADVRSAGRRPRRRRGLLPHAGPEAPPARQGVPERQPARRGGAGRRARPRPSSADDGARVAPGRRPRLHQGVVGARSVSTRPAGPVRRRRRRPSNGCARCSSGPPGRTRSSTSTWRNTATST